VLEFRRRPASLDARERDVLRAVVAAERNRSIARSLHVSGRTMDRLRAKVLAKMSTHSAVELARLTGFVEEFELLWDNLGPTIGASNARRPATERLQTQLDALRSQVPSCPKLRLSEFRSLMDGVQRQPHHHPKES
jgi:DNA-binding CsgD family transcriptional regulator